MAKQNSREMQLTAMTRCGFLPYIVRKPVFPMEVDRAALAPE